MNLRGYPAVLILALAGSVCIAAQENMQSSKPAAGCVPVKKKTAGALSAAESKFVPIRSTTGDLNADGRDEEIVLVRHIGKSEPRPDELLVYEMEGGDVRLLTQRQVGRAGEYVLSIKSFNSNFNVRNGLLLVDLAVLGDGKSEPPQRFRTIAYRWDGKGLVEAERSETKPLPEHMREIG